MKTRLLLAVVVGMISVPAFAAGTGRVTGQELVELRGAGASACSQNVAVVTPDTTEGKARSPKTPSAARAGYSAGSAR